MATVSYNGQSFTLDGRRLWILGASIQYARIARDDWPARLAAARQAGFNTIETACPWMLHEPRRGRYDFEGDLDVRAFVEACGEAGLRVILRAGPFVGGGFDAGGIPGWLVDDPGTLVRESSEAFLERVTRWSRRLFSEVGDLQATSDGPIILVQAEHNWTCANDDEAERYLGSVVRTIRESGATVPVYNANNLWPPAVDTIDTWQGRDDMLANVRQLRSVQPGAPRIVSALEVAEHIGWGSKLERAEAPASVQRRVAEVLAAGGQPIVAPFHGGTYFGFTAGRLPGIGTVTTSAAGKAPLGEAGHRGASYAFLRRVVTFADQFGPVFAELTPETQPVALDPQGAGTSVVSLHGGGGRVVFVFADKEGARTTLLLENGARLPVSIGQQRVGWYLLDADLGGAGRLDYANLMPFALVDRSILVLYGPAGTTGILSIDGTPLEVTVPSRSKPLITSHEGMTLVICNESQIDEAYIGDDHLYLGVSGIGADGAPIISGSKAHAVARDGTLEPLASTEGRTSSKPRPRKLSTWSFAPSTPQIDGSSPRYATLQGPTSLTACGATAGYGWYRVAFRVNAAKKRRIHIPEAGDRFHLYLDGEPIGTFGTGPGAAELPLEMRLAKGDHVLTALVENAGRFADGNDFHQPMGIAGSIFEIKALTGVRSRVGKAEPVDAFAVRRFILGGTAGAGSDVEQAIWEFTHAKKAPIIVEVGGVPQRGTFALNDVPIAFYAGDTGASQLRLLLDPGTTEPMRRGKNVLRFAPERGQDAPARAVGKATNLYLCVEDLGAGAAWAFGKWEKPAAGTFREVAADDLTKRHGTPGWWRSEFDAPSAPMPLWLDLSGMSKGFVRVNGRDLGRYFTATRTNRAVGPQVRLYIPAAWLQKSGNEVLVFDEHGFAPGRVKLIQRETGDLD